MLGEKNLRNDFDWPTLGHMLTPGPIMVCILQLPPAGDEGGMEFFRKKDSYHSRQANKKWLFRLVIVAPFTPSTPGAGLPRKFALLKVPL